MVAERCGCNAYAATAGARSNSSTAAPRAAAKSLKAFGSLDDRSVVLLKQIFLECRDSLSSFRLAVLLSSRWSSLLYRFTMDETMVGKTKKKYTFDVCVRNRSTDQLVAVGMQNNDEGQRASGKETVEGFLAAVRDLCASNPSLQSAYYASSYGYRDFPLVTNKKKRLLQQQTCEEKVEIKFFEYRDTVYFEMKPH